MSEPRARIWIVDDSATNRMHTERTLGDTYVYEQFADGSELVERIGSGAVPPDLVLLDWVMPGMSGDVVTRFLRTREATRDLPIILVTASRVETEDVVAGLGLGANDYVARPFVPAELIARVKSVLRTKQLNDASVRERMRLSAINNLGRVLFELGPNVQAILDQLARTLTTSICDGCAVLLLPGEFADARASSHHADPSGSVLSEIGTVADPATFSFESTEHALTTLPPAYHPYIRRFGMRSLAILPFPIRAPIQGVVTVTRDGGSLPLDPDDLATIETCIDYASLAVQNAVRFESELIARGRLDAILAHAPIGIVVTDESGAVARMNPVAMALLSAPGAVAELEASIGAIDGKAEIRRTEIRLSERALSLVTAPLRTRASDIAGTVTTIADVTDALEFASERERVAQYQEQMLGIVGHDLKNPLSAILAGAEAIGIRAEAVPGVTTLVSRIGGTVRRMTRIVDQLHDVTRARLGGGIPLAVVEVSLAAVAQAVIDELTLASPNALLELHATGDLDGVWDPDRLGQVIANLASNALQYGASKRPVVIDLGGTPTTVTIRVTNQLRDQPIPADQLAGLFQPYRRGQEGTQRLSGLGLGLYIVHELVRAHHGEVFATSSHEAGTVFVVTLPRSSRS